VSVTKVEVKADKAVMEDAARTVDARPLTGAERFLRTFVHHRLALISAVYLLVLLATAVFGQFLLTHEPNEVDLSRAFEAPSADHWLGTDHLGRSTLSRTVSASGVALRAAALGVGISIVLGAPLGLISGFFGGWFDRIAMRIVEAIIALPALLVAIAIIAILGPNLTNAMIALGIAGSTAFFRLMRGAALEVREAVYIDAARVSGAPSWRILLHHVLPNVTGPLTVQTTLAFSFILLAEAGLSFIGLGVQPPESSWGIMLATAQNFVYQQPFLAVPPGVMIMLTVLAFNLLGDGLRDALSRVESNTAAAVIPAIASVEGISTPSALDNTPMAVRVAGASAKSASVAPVAAEPVASKPARLLDVSGLTVHFAAPRGGEVAVVSEVGFHLEAGHTLGLVGESGCGKSVTAMSVMGLLGNAGRIVSGSIEFNGQQLVGAPANVLEALRGRDIGMVFQEASSSLNPVFTVGQQICEVLARHERLSNTAARKRAIELLERVGIAGAQRRIDAYPHQFSGGMAQRVMIAMALAHRPLLLIADEPTTALDVSVQAQVLDLLTDLQQENGMAILLITHDLGVVADMCDDAAVMYAGQVIESGPMAQLLTAPQHPYTAGLLAAMPQTQSRGAKLLQIPGRVPPAWNWPHGCRFHPRCPAATDECMREAVPQVTLTDGVQLRCLRHGELDARQVWS
jgi:peptide/nickel transport system permease protein